MQPGGSSEAILLGAAAGVVNAIGSAASGAESWLPILVQSGAIGLLAFVLWHVFAKFIPKILDSQAQALKDFREEARQIREDFRETLKEVTKR